MANAPIPMTTIFTPPSDCLASITYVAANSGLILGAGSTCAPDGSGALDSNQIFSPALNCPSGWTVAASSTITIGNSVTETLATCCPLISQLSLPGASDMYIETEYYDYVCQASVAGGIPQEIVWNGSTTYTTSFNWNESYTYFQATSVQIAWQATDVLPRTSTSSSTSQTSTSTPASSAAAASSTSSASHGSSSLSTTAKIVIGVVVPVVVIALLIGLGFFIINRRKSKQRSTTHEIQQEITQYDPAYDSDPHAANRMMMMSNDGYYGNNGANTPSTYVEKSPRLSSRPTTVNLH